MSLFITTFIPSTMGGYVFTRIYLLTGGYLPWMREYLPWLGVPTLDVAGGTYLTRGMYPSQGVQTLGQGYLSWLGVPTLARGYLPWMGEPTLDRLCRRRYASCGFLQENFLVINVNKTSYYLPSNLCSD